MTINSIDSTSPLQNANNPMMQKRLEAVKEKFGEDSYQFSMASQMMSFMSGLSAEDKTEMRAFDQEMRQGVKSGAIDFSEMAEKAPEPLKSFADEHGINLEDMLRNGAERRGGMESNFYNRMGKEESLNTNEIEGFNIIEALFPDEEE